MLALWTLRIVGAGGFAALGWRLGGIVSEITTDEERFLPWGLVLTLAGGVSRSIHHALSYSQTLAEMR